MLLKKILILSLIVNTTFLLYYGRSFYKESMANNNTPVQASAQPVKELEYPDKPEFPPYYYTRVSVFEDNPIPNGGIVFLGDSLTDHNEWEEVFPNAYNRGISGDNTQGLNMRLNQIMAGKPSKIFLMIGINDFIQGYRKEKILGSYTSIIKRFHEELPDTKVYIQSVLPVNNKMSNLVVKNQDIQWFNRELTLLANQNGYTFIDLYSLYVNEKNQLNQKVTVDGAHLDGPAYKLWENKIKPYVDAE